MRRRGFSLTELMIALVMAGIIGIALTRLLINQSRFVGLQQGMLSARAGARAGFNVMVQELHMITGDSAVADATRDSITVRVPYAFGVMCTQPSGGYQAIALLPYDSATYASAIVSGYGWRDTSGVWHRKESGVTITSGQNSDCSGASPSIAVLAAVVRASPNITVASGGPTPGCPGYLYQRIRYAFGPSAQLSGRRALWRTVLDTGRRDELVAPFDTSSHFSFLTGDSLGVSTTPPTHLDSLRGVKIRLVGQSETAPEGRTSYVTFDLATNIVFVNRAAN